MPYQVSDVLEQLRQGTFQVHIENPGIDEIDDHIDKATNRIAVALVILGGLLGSAMIGVFAKTGPHALGIHLIALVGFLISGDVRVLARLGHPPARATLTSRPRPTCPLRNACRSIRRKGHLAHAAASD